MTLDRELYAILTKHILDGAEVSEVLAILTSHVTMIIQSVPTDKANKLQIAKEVMYLVVESIIEDPNPTARKLN